MIRYTAGDILNADTAALVNTVNCVGVMGRGIALQFKNAFPANFKIYEAACKRGEVQPGKMLVVETNELNNPRYIINFPTKRHWRGKSRIEDVESGLKALRAEILNRNIPSIAIPPLGAGLGGLQWRDVRALIEQELSDLPDVDIAVFEPIGPLAAEAMVKSKEVPAMTAGRAALVALMDRYLQGLMDPFVSLLELHKLMYFMQEAGEDLNLKYAKALYGPYAENLRHVLRAIEGHFISGYADGGDAPDKKLELVPGAVPDADSYLSDKTDTRTRFNRVADLVQGFETPFGLELLATVHWVASREDANDLDAVIAKTYAWNDRKKRFSREQIGLAFKLLDSKGWIGRDVELPSDRMQ